MSTQAAALDFSSRAGAYEGLLVGPLFRPWAELLIERAEVRAGDRVLDVACGTGIVARLARDRAGDNARVVGVDVSPEMLAVARAVEPRVEWREGNALSLPFVAADRFDVVTCHQGLQFFPDRPHAAAEMRRVLAPGGRLAVGSWRPLDEMPWLAELHRVAEWRLGQVSDQRYAFGHDGALAALLVDAGFDDVRVEVVTREIRFSDPTVFPRMNAMAIVAMSAVGWEMSGEERAATAAAIVRDSEELVASRIQGDELVYEVRSNIATARR